MEGALAAAWDIISDQAPTVVRLRFSAAVAGRVQEIRWHPTQAVEAGPDGRLSWSATVSGTVEIRSWILGWGADVEVLAPAELRAEIGTIAATAAAQYQGDH
jgi:proteasome accessory factor B